MARAAALVLRGGLKAYLEESTGLPSCPQSPFCHDSPARLRPSAGRCSGCQKGSCWGKLRQPHPYGSGGTHVNGLRTGLGSPAGVLRTPQSPAPGAQAGSGGSLGTLRLRALSQDAGASIFWANKGGWPPVKPRPLPRVAKDAFSLWLNQHTAEGEALAERAIRNAKRRLQAVKKVAQRITAGPALPGKLADCSSDDLGQGELFLVEDSAELGKQAGIGLWAVMPLRGKILNTWEVAPARCSPARKCTTLPWPLGSIREAAISQGYATARSAPRKPPIPTGSTLRPCLCALLASPALVKRTVFVAVAPLPHRPGQNSLLRP